MFDYSSEKKKEDVVYGEGDDAGDEAGFDDEAEAGAVETEHVPRRRV